MRTLIARLIADVRAFVAAEIALARQTAASWAAAARLGAALIVVAMMLVLAGVTVLVAAVGMVLALWTGPIAGLALAGMLAILAAGLCGWLAFRHFAAMVR